MGTPEDVAAEIYFTPPETALIQISPQTDAAIIALLSECEGLRKYAQSRVIATNDDVKAATDDLTLIAKLKRTLEDKRKEYTGPINTHLKAINEAFKMLMAPVEQADQLTRSKILAYRQEQDRKAREVEEINRLRMEAAQREAAMNNGEIKEPVQIVEAPIPVVNKVYVPGGTLGIMKVRKYRVVDFALLPNQYKIENSALLNKVVKAGIPSIPGVQIYEEETLRVTEADIEHLINRGR